MKFVKEIGIAALAVLAPIKPMLIVVGILIFADLILGMIAARKRKEPITSAAMRRTVSKMLIYHTAIVTGFLCEKYLIGDIIPISKLVAGVIGLVEFKSILENSNEINGVPIFKMLIDKLGSENDKLQK